MGRSFRVSEELETVGGSPYLTVQLPTRPCPCWEGGGASGRPTLGPSHTATCWLQ